MKIKARFWKNKEILINSINHEWNDLIEDIY